MNHHRLTRAAAALAATALFTGLLAPTAGARPADAPVASAPAVDLRMPDTRDAAREAARDRYVDLRSPDTRDAAREAAGDVAPQVTSAVSTRESDGDDWVYVALAGAGLVLLMLGATTGVRRRTDRNRTAREAARA